MSSVAAIHQAIREDMDNLSYTQRGIEPLYAAPPQARICLVGQAPGSAAERTQLYWNDPSGDRLRAWAGIPRDVFYSSEQIAVLPMDFYYPGRGKSGDLPPRKGFAAKWHPQLIAHMPQIQLYLLIGSYAQRYYLGLKPTEKLTDVVFHYHKYQPHFFPLVHPSPRNNIWLAKHPWFETHVVPALKERVSQVLD